MTTTTNTHALLLARGFTPIVLASLALGTAGIAHAQADASASASAPSAGAVEDAAGTTQAVAAPVPASAPAPAPEPSEESDYVPGSAVITAVVGRVQVSPAAPAPGEDAQWVKPMVGMVLGSGAQIRTGPSSMLSVDIVGQTIEFRRMGKFTLTQLLRETTAEGNEVDRTRIEVDQGLLTFDVEEVDAKNDLRIKTLDATLAVTGTGGAVKAEAGGTRATGTEGTYSFTVNATGQRGTVNQGDQSSSGTPSPAANRKSSTTVRTDNQNASPTNAEGRAAGRSPGGGGSTTSSSTSGGLSNNPLRQIGSGSDGDTHSDRLGNLLRRAGVSDDRLSGSPLDNNQGNDGDDGRMYTNSELAKAIISTFLSDQSLSFINEGGITAGQLASIITDYLDRLTEEELVSIENAITNDPDSQLYPSDPNEFLRAFGQGLELEGDGQNQQYIIAGDADTNTLASVDLTDYLQGAQEGEDIAGSGIPDPQGRFAETNPRNIVGGTATETISQGLYRFYQLVGGIDDTGEVYNDVWVTNATVVQTESGSELLPLLPFELHNTYGEQDGGEYESFGTPMLTGLAHLNTAQGGKLYAVGNIDNFQHSLYELTPEGERIEILPFSNDMYMDERSFFQPEAVAAAGKRGSLFLVSGGERYLDTDDADVYGPTMIEYDPSANIILNTYGDLTTAFQSTHDTTDFSVRGAGFASMTGEGESVQDIVVVTGLYDLNTNDFEVLLDPDNPQAGFFEYGVTTQPGDSALLGIAGVDVPGFRPPRTLLSEPDFADSIIKDNPQVFQAMSAQLQNMAYTFNALEQSDFIERWSIEIVLNESDSIYELSRSDVRQMLLDSATTESQVLRLEFVNFADTLRGFGYVTEAVNVYLEEQYGDVYTRPGEGEF